MALLRPPRRLEAIMPGLIGVTTCMSLRPRYSISDECLSRESTMRSVLPAVQYCCVPLMIAVDFSILWLGSAHHVDGPGQPGAHDSGDPASVSGFQKVAPDVAVFGGSHRFTN